MKPTLIKYFITHNSLEKAATFELNKARFYVASPLLRLLNVFKCIAGWCWLETGETPLFIGSIYYFFYLNYFYFYIRKLDCLCKKGTIYCWWDLWLIFSEFLALGDVSVGCIIRRDVSRPVLTAFSHNRSSNKIAHIFPVQK